MNRSIILALTMAIVTMRILKTSGSSSISSMLLSMEESAEESTDSSESTDEETESVTAMASTNPTVNPTSQPSTNPTANPTVNPSGNPTSYPTTNPTNVPTTMPTINPSMNPTMNPVMDGGSVGICGANCDGCNCLDDALCPAGPVGTCTTIAGLCDDCRDDPNCEVDADDICVVAAGPDIVQYSHLLKRARDDQHEASHKENENKVWTIGFSQNITEKIWIMLGIYMLSVCGFCICHTLCNKKQPQQQIV